MPSEASAKEGSRSRLDVPENVAEHQRERKGNNEHQEFQKPGHSGAETTLIAPEESGLLILLRRAQGKLNR